MLDHYYPTEVLKSMQHVRLTLVQIDLLENYKLCQTIPTLLSGKLRLV